MSEAKKTAEVMEYFSSEAPEIQRLGQGIHNGIFYIGAIATTNEQAVVTSDHKLYVRRVVWPKPKDDEKKKLTPEIYDDIKSKFGLNYRSMMEPGLRGYAWRNSIGQYSISSWLMGSAPKVTTRELFERIKDQFERYIDFPDKRIYDFVACDVMADYVSCLFESRGITHFYGFKGSGKSKSSRLYKLMGFNPLMTSKISPAALFRAVEANCPRVIIDNFDFLKNEELRAAYNQALQTGWEYDGCAHLCDKDHGNKIVAFRTFAPYLVNNILGLDDVTADRSTKITMLKTISAKGKMKPNTKAPEWAEIRDMAHVWALQTWQDITDVAAGLDLDLNNRERDVAYAVLTIAKAAGQDVFDNIMSWLKERNKDKGIRDIATDWEYMLWTELLNRVKNPAGDWVVLADVAQSLSIKIYEGSNLDELAKQTKKMKRWVPSVINKIPIFSERRLLHGLTEVKFTPGKIRNVMQLKEYPEPEKDKTKPEAEKGQTTLPQSTHPPNSPSSTSLYQNRVSVVESGESGEQKDIGGLSAKPEIIAFCREKLMASDDYVTDEEVVRLGLAQGILMRGPGGEIVKV